jgi:hypothetical protein
VCDIKVAIPQCDLSRWIAALLDKTGNREVGLQLTTGGTNNASEALSGP